MKKRVVSVLLSLLMCFMAIPYNMVSFADDTEQEFVESGTKNDPYQINSYFKLALLSERINETTMDGTNEKYKDAYFIQTADITIPDGVNWTPIGTFTPTDSNTKRFYFAGHYDGNYHFIKNLNCNSDNSYVGLFGRLGENGTDYTNKCVISNLSVYGNITSKGNIVGGIAGEACAGSTIENCSFNGNVLGNESVGGIAGMTYNGGYIRNCYHNGTVTSTNKNVGGIIGALRVGNYEFSVNAGVYNSYHTGGIVEATNGAVGGICGYLEYGEKNKDCKIILENNYYLSSTCSVGVNGNNSSGCSKLDADFMKNVNELLGSPFVYNESEEINNGYPVFEWQAVPYQFRGSGTADDPYQISSKEELEKMRDLVNSKFFTEQYSNKCYIQTADIDLENELWTPIGTRMINNVDQSAPLFWGSYNGNGHTIKNLYVNETEKNNYSGLFGSHRGNGIIENLIVYGEIKSNGAAVGGIAGEVVNGGGIIRNCAFIGDVTGNDSVGGIAGVIWQKGTIENCYHIGSVLALTAESNYIGGIVGRLVVGDSGLDNTFAIVRNCYNIGKVTGLSNGIGSIVGNMTHREKVDGEIYVENCYSIKGDVSGNISGNYTTNYDVTELSESMMRNVAGKLGDAFVKNPDSNFNNGYPVFTWQIKGDINGDGVFNIADVIILQKWLISEGNVTLKNWKNADLCEDNRLDSFDLVMMKKQLIG